MEFLPWKEDVAKTLDGASVRVDEIKHLSNESLLVTLTKGQTRYKLNLQIVEVLEAKEAPTPQRKGKRKTGKRNNVFKSRKFWDVETLKREGLPLYWNKEWFVKAYEQHGSMIQIAQEYGWSDNGMGEFAKKHHGLRFTRGRSPKMIEQEE